MKKVLALLLVLCVTVCSVVTSCKGEEIKEEKDEIVQTEALDNEITYVLNTKSKKFHYPSCHSASKIKESNKATFVGTREELIADGYSPCGNCDP